MDSETLTVEISSKDFPPALELEEFKAFPFELDHFQKWAIHAIKNHINVLVTAKTGAGKTVIAEYAIRKCLAEGRKVIYTSPIKSLSNQKFQEFKQKFSTSSSTDDNPIGIITGDIKFNPEAQCLIMTTEILRNLLYYQEVVLDHLTGLSLKMDVGREVGAVIFDEVHYINDRERGKVWEECFILLPREIDLVLLSATIDKAEEFGGWLQQIKQKPLRLIQTDKRVVPLKHFLFWNWKSNQRALAQMNPVDQKRLETAQGLELVSFGDEGEFLVDTYREIYQVQQKFGKLMLGHREILNQMVDYLREHQMLPAIFFTLSRNKCQEYAQMLSRSLNDGGEQAEVDSIIEKELRKLENFERYRQLNEFENLRSLLVKGIAYHHSGMIPIFKEIIEILFAKNLIKVLLATETFAVGVNMPTKTVVFTGLTKVDSSTRNGASASDPTTALNNKQNSGDFRWLASHEYTQMTGRAGRRGLDKIGYIILLPNLYNLPNVEAMRQMKLGAPPAVVSKFSLNYQLILRVVLNGSADLEAVIRGSLWFRELESENHATGREILELQSWKAQLEADPKQQSDLTECLNYDALLSNSEASDEITFKVSQKVLKKQRQMANQLRAKPGFLEKYQKYQNETAGRLKRLKHLTETEISSSDLVKQHLTQVLNFLSSYGYISGCISGDWNVSPASTSSETQNDVPNEPAQMSVQGIQLRPEAILTKGVLASRVSQCQELLLVEMLTTGIFEDLKPEEIVGILACFSQIKTDTPVVRLDAKIIPNALIQAIKKTQTIADDLSRAENQYGLASLDSQWNLSLNLVTGAYIWATNGEWIQVMEACPTFSGNLVKELLKVNHLSQELAELARLMNNQKLLVVCEQVPERVLRGLVTIESLYLK